MGAVTGLDSVKAQRVMMGPIYYLIFPDQASIEELTGEIVTMGPGIILWVSILTETARLRRRWRQLCPPFWQKKTGEVWCISRERLPREKNFLFPFTAAFFFVGIFPGLSVSHGDGAYHLL